MKKTIVKLAGLLTALALLLSCAILPATLATEEQPPEAEQTVEQTPEAEPLPEQSGEGEQPPEDVQALTQEGSGGAEPAPGQPQEGEEQPPEPAAEPEPKPNNIRIGLSYGSAATPGANLQNGKGSGFRLGYYDGDLRFHTLASTGQALISVVKTQNVYYLPSGNGSSYQRYTDQLKSDTAVGCFHIQFPGGYGTYEEAASAASWVQGTFLAWVEGTYYVRLGAYLTGDAARAALAELGTEGATVEGSSAYAVSVVKTGTSEILFQFDGGAGLPFGVQPGLDDTVKTETWYLGNPYYGGFRFERLDGGNMTVVNIVDVEDYVSCVISREMSESWPLEALKAQACCARTYAARVKRHTSYHFDLCTTTDCQAYPGCGSIGPTITQAAQDTAGKYIWYEDTLAETYYYSSNGGASEDSVNVWVTAYPYLTGREDPYEALIADRIPQYQWRYNFGKTELARVAQRLRDSGRAVGEIVEMYISALTSMGNVRSLTFKDSNGKSWTLYGGDARNYLGVRSQRFTIYGGGSFYVDGVENSLSSMAGVYAIGGDGSIQEVSPAGGMPYVITADGVTQLYEDSETYTVVGTGWGHNVGMSQYGAFAMAQQGYTYEDILKFYYMGVDIR